MVAGEKSLFVLYLPFFKMELEQSVKGMACTFMFTSYHVSSFSFVIFFFYFFYYFLTPSFSPTAPFFFLILSSFIIVLLLFPLPLLLLSPFSFLLLSIIIFLLLRLSRLLFLLLQSPIVDPSACSHGPLPQVNTVSLPLLGCNMKLREKSLPFSG